MTENAPTLALGATIAFGSTTAVGWIPSALISRSRLAGLRSGDPEAALELLKTALGGAQTARHVGQVLLGGEEPLGLEHRQRRRAQPPLAGGHVLVDAGLGAEDRSVADRQVVREPDLARRDDAAAEVARARDPDLSHDDRVLADLDVVTDLDEVVDLGPAADDRPAEHGAIDRRVGADVHVVLDHDGTDLRDLAMAAAVEDVAESVAADDGAGLDDHTAPEPHPFAQNDARMEHRLLAHLDERPDIDERMHPDPRPYDRARGDHRQGTDRGARVHVRATMAKESRPAGVGAGGWNSVSSAIRACCGALERRSGPARPDICSETSKAPARDVSAAGRYRASIRKEICSGPAASSGATPVTRRPGSPSSVAPRVLASSPSVNPAGVPIRASSSPEPAGRTR